MNDFTKMRRKRQQLSEEEAIELLRHATSGVLSVFDEDGYNPDDEPALETSNLI